MASNYDHYEWQSNLSRSTNAAMTHGFLLYAAAKTREYLEATPDMSLADLVANFETEAAELAELHDRLDRERAAMRA